MSEYIKKYESDTDWITERMLDKNRIFYIPTQHDSLFNAKKALAAKFKAAHLEVFMGDCADEVI